MEWHVGSKNIRTISKIFKYFDQLGSLVKCEWDTKKLTLQTLNNVHSALVLVKIYDEFFSEIRDATASYRLNAAEDDDNPYVWQVALRPCATAFRGVKEVESCVVRADYENKKMVFEMRCRKRIKKTYKVLYTDDVIINVKYLSNLPYHFTLAPKQILDFLCTIQTGISEVTFSFSPKRFILKTYHDQRGEIGRRDVSSEFSITDFDGATLPPEDTEMTVNLGDLKRILKLCTMQQLSFPMFSFDVPGNPIIIRAASSQPIVIELEAVLSTLSTQQDYDESQNANDQNGGDVEMAENAPAPESQRNSVPTAANVSTDNDQAEMDVDADEQEAVKKQLRTSQATISTESSLTESLHGISMASLEMPAPTDSVRSSLASPITSSPQFATSSERDKVASSGTNFNVQNLKAPQIKQEIPDGIKQAEDGDVRLFSGDVPFRREDDTEQQYTSLSQMSPVDQEM